MLLQIAYRTAAGKKGLAELDIEDATRLPNYDTVLADLKNVRPDVQVVLVAYPGGKQ